MRRGVAGALVAAQVLVRAAEAPGTTDATVTAGHTTVAPTARPSR